MHTSILKMLFSIFIFYLPTIFLTSFFILLFLTSFDYFTFQDSDDEISHLEWETVRVRFVKAGTLQKLVEALATDDGELETTYINVFLATYRSFSTPKEVLKLLLQRYEELAVSPKNGKPDHHEQHRK